MKVVKELWELNLISDLLADMLSNDFDEYAFLIETKPRPEFILSILDKKSGDAPSARAEWAKEITDEYLSGTLNFRMPDNSYILSEHSILEGMGWGHNEEIRQSFVDFSPEIEFGSARSLIFNLTSNYNIKEYTELLDNGISLYNGLLTVNKRRNWLAINPLLCMELGLVYNSNGGNFRWDDKHGNKVVESIFWQIHSSDNHSKNHHSEAGYGWYVILYSNGHKMFKKIIGERNLFQHKKVSRHVRYRQERYSTNITEDFYKTKSQGVLLK